MAADRVPAGHGKPAQVFGHFSLSGRRCAAPG